MASPVLVPRLGYGAAPAVITEWYHPDGATVRRGEAVCCLESGHVAIDLEADADGILRHFTGDGPAPATGEPVAYVLAPGERLPEPPEEAHEPEPAFESPAPAHAEAPPVEPDAFEAALAETLSPEPIPFPEIPEEPRGEADAPNPLWDDAPAPIIDLHAPLLRRRTLPQQTEPAFHWVPEAESWPDAAKAAVTADHGNPAAFVPDPATDAPLEAWEEPAEDSLAPVAPAAEAEATPAPAWAAWEVPAAPEEPEMSLADALHAGELAATAESEGMPPPAWAAWEAADEPATSLPGALNAEESTWEAFEETETAAETYTDDDQPHAGEPVAIHIVHPDPVGEGAVEEPAEEPYRWYDEEAAPESPEEPAEEVEPYVFAPEPARIVPFPLTMRVTVTLGDALKLRERLAHEWAPAGVIPTTEDIAVRALACALAGQPALEEHARSVGLRALDPDGVTVQVFAAASDGELRDVVEARAAVPPWPATDAHCGATLTSLFDFGIDDSVPALAPGNALAVSLGAPRRVSTFRPDGIELVTVSTVTLAYDPGAVPEGAAAAFLASLRDLLESPETLLAA
ncbi:MAG: 2-oxo acid dehydrogenase subunit E2 [Chloroflexi bacterium]|nr:2-oxo acid dehydrogenase subunit E2 [Chloroflexota bacterium]